MTEGFTGIIDQLERQKAAIERALTALGEIGGGAAPIKATTATPTTAGTPGRKKRSPAVSKRMREASPMASGPHGTCSTKVSGWGRLFVSFRIALGYALVDTSHHHSLRAGGRVLGG